MRLNLNKVKGQKCYLVSFNLEPRLFANSHATETDIKRRRRRRSCRQTGFSQENFPSHREKIYKGSFIPIYAITEIANSPSPTHQSTSTASDMSAEFGCLFGSFLALCCWISRIWGISGIRGDWIKKAERERNVLLFTVISDRH